MAAKNTSPIAAMEMKRSENNQTLYRILCISKLVSHQESHVIRNSDLQTYFRQLSESDAFENAIQAGERSELILAILSIIETLRSVELESAITRLMSHPDRKVKLAAIQTSFAFNRIEARKELIKYLSQADQGDLAALGDSIRSPNMFSSSDVISSLSEAILRLPSDSSSVFLLIEPKLKTVDSSALLERLVASDIETNKKSAMLASCMSNGLYLSNLNLSVITELPAQEAFLTAYCCISSPANTSKELLNKRLILKELKKGNKISNEGMLELLLELSESDSTTAQTMLVELFPQVATVQLDRYLMRLGQHGLLSGVAHDLSKCVGNGDAELSRRLVCAKYDPAADLDQTIALLDEALQRQY